MKQQIADLEKALKALDKAGLRLSVTTVKADNALADAGNQFALAGKKAKASAQAIDQFIQSLDKTLPKRAVSSQQPIVVVNTIAPAPAVTRPVNPPTQAPAPSASSAAPKKAPERSSNSDKSDEEKGWNAGRKAAIAKYIEAASDMATPMESIVTNAFTNLETSLFDFVKTGKFNWNNLLVGVADEALRMLIKAGIGALLESITGPKKKENEAAAMAAKAVQGKVDPAVVPAEVSPAAPCVPCCGAASALPAPVNPESTLYGLRVPGLTRFADPNEDLNGPMFGTRLPGYGNYPAMPGTSTPGVGTYSNMFGSRLPGFGADPFSLNGHVPGLGGMDGAGPMYGGNGSFFGPQPGPASDVGAGDSSTSFFTAELRKFADTAIDVSGLTQQVFETAFENIEQTLFNFVKTGELDLRGLFVGISDEILKMLIKVGVRMAVNAMLGETIGASTTASSAAQAATIASAWSAPATLVSLATQGANAAPASLGIASTYAVARLSGVAHSGIDRVPYEGTWLLDKGERVLSARQNSDLTGYLQDAGNAAEQPGAQGFQINVAVNMTNGEGQTQVDGDDAQGRQLGTLIAAQVQQTLSREMRQGGLLWNQRNGYTR